ncbi:hypothetical protein C8F01DRAFT_1176268 [Mycena amicta]|nr:hypothetical protein C8F01DRAFT_1176268 [Mycena amicta]
MLRRLALRVARNSRPRYASTTAIASSSSEKIPYVAKQPKHGRTTRKARAAAPRKKWVKPPARTSPTEHARLRAEKRRLRLAKTFTDPRARTARFRVGFHVVRHARPLQRGRRGRLPKAVKAKMADKGLLETRRNRKRLGRPEISLKQPRGWNPPLRQGVLPAYDEAVKLIRKDAWQVRKEAQQLRKEIQTVHDVLCAEGKERVEGQERTALEQRLEQMREKLHILDVQSEVNLPEVRWSVANGMVDMTIPSHRHLVEQRWRKDGDLDLLMERLHQMHVVPDVLPIIHPSIDLRLTARLMPEHFESLMRRNRSQRGVNTFKEVIPGNYLTSRQTRAPPKLYANVFHTDVRLYTMLMVDPDVPDPENQTYTTFLHWLKPNIPLSATHAGRIPFLNTHTRYIPPHPQRGTPYHRYVTLLLPQPPQPGLQYNRNTEALMTDRYVRYKQSLQDQAAMDAARAAAVEAAVAEATQGRTPSHRPRPTHPNARLPVSMLADIPSISSRLMGMPIVPDSERLGFDVRAFIKQWRLNPAHGGGAHMFREVWDNDVGAVYRYDLHQSQPRYGRPPRENARASRTETVSPRQRYRLGV